VPSTLSRSLTLSRVERVAASTIFFNVVDDLDVLLEMHSLTHLALANPCIARTNHAFYDVGLFRFLNRSRLQRAIFGFPVSQPDFWSTLHDYTPRRENLNIVCLEYNVDGTDREGHYWFGARVADGTLWDMEE
jgi:hypothetical protein